MIGERTNRLQDGRPVYDPPRVLRLGALNEGLGDCQFSGSGASDCLEPGNVAPVCAAAGNSADPQCGGTGRSATNYCTEGPGGPDN